MDKTKTGYKKTELGLIPEDWFIYKINQIAQIKTGDKDTQDKLDTGIYPFYVRSDNIERINSHSFDGEAVLTSGDGVGVGKIFHYINGKFDFHQRVYCLHGFKKNIYGYYFYFQFASNFYERVMSMTAKSSVDSVRREMISEMKILFPPTLAEQKAIATALSDVDALIEKLDALITKKQAIKEGAMQKLLKPNPSWKKISILQIAEGKKELFDDGDWIEAEHITTKGVRLIQTGNIGKGSFVEKDNRKYVYEDSFEKLKCKTLKEGDLLICRLAEPAGRACLLPDIGEKKVITSVDVTIFRPREEIANRHFLNQIFSTREWLKKVSEMCGGTTHKRISRGALGRIKIQIPEIDEQKAIAKILSDMDLEIEKLQAKKAKYEKIKEGMMQELLTGKTRLV